jgi:hypothetical protein
MDIPELLAKAFDKANRQPNEGITRKEINRNRSKNFVEYLASELRTHYQGNPNTYVLSKHYAKNRKKFGLNELLFDILVCKGQETVSTNKSTALTYISKGILAIESEMARDSREALYDFNKLILSSCDSKLFIGPLVPNVESFLKPLATAAKYCDGEIHLALIPHPNEWAQATRNMIVYKRWNGSAWT